MINKNLNIELIKSISIFAVILIHLSSPYFYSHELFVGHSAYWLTSNMLYAFSRCSVPLFFMSTAFIFFNSTKDYDLIKRISRLSLAYFSWSVIYFFSSRYSDPHTVGSFIKSTIFGTVETHLWFIPVFIGYVVLLPIIKAYFFESRDMNKDLIGSLIVIFVVVVPFVTMILTKINSEMGFVRGINQFSITIPAFLSFPIGMYLLGNYDGPKKYISFLSYFFICIAITLLNTNWSYFKNEITEDFFGYTTPLVYLSSFFAFFFLMKIDLSKLSGINKSIILNIGASSFGIYLSHILIRDVLQSYNLIMWGNPLVSPIFNTIIIFSLSLLLVIILRRIPLIKKFV